MRLATGKLIFYFYYFISEAEDGAGKGDRNGEHDEEHARTWKVAPEICGEQESCQSTSPRQTEMKTETKFDTEMNT